MLVVLCFKIKNNYKYRWDDGLNCIIAIFTIKEVVNESIICYLGID